jgi:hypothetical protein
MTSNFLNQKQVYDKTERMFRESCERIITQVAVAYRGKDVEIKTEDDEVHISVATTGEILVDDEAMVTRSTDYLSDAVTTILQYLSDNILQVLYSEAGNDAGVDKRMDGVRNKDDDEDGAYYMSADASGFDKLLFAAMKGVRPVSDFREDYDEYDEEYKPTMEEVLNLLYLLDSFGERDGGRIVWALYDYDLHGRGDFEELVGEEKDASSDEDPQAGE